MSRRPPGCNGFAQKLPTSRRDMIPREVSGRFCPRRVPSRPGAVFTGRLASEKTGKHGLRLPDSRLRAPRRNPSARRDGDKELGSRGATWFNHADPGSAAGPSTPGSDPPPRQTLASTLVWKEGTIVQSQDQIHGNQRPIGTQLGKSDPVDGNGCEGQPGSARSSEGVVRDEQGDGARLTWRRTLQSDTRPRD